MVALAIAAVSGCGLMLLIPGGELSGEVIADPRVRVRFDNRIHPLKAVHASEPGEIEGFDSDRFVYRLDPR